MRILDPCCGGRMFWFDKQNPLVEFCDIRKEKYDFSQYEGFKDFVINPDKIADFTNLPHQNEFFDMVVFDPPHLKQSAGNGWQAKKYGKLDDDYETHLAKGFSECFRVLKTGGFLIFKWNETHLPVSQIIGFCEYNPLFGHKSGKASKTHWLCFGKNDLMKKEMES